jgi:hypothetical protein
VKVIFKLPVFDNASPFASSGKALRNNWTQG